MVSWVRRISSSGIGLALALLLGGAASRGEALDRDVRPEVGSAPCERFNTNLVVDPGFEAPRIRRSPYVPLDYGDSISAWMALGPVDLISADYWNAAEGGQSLDLDGSCGTGGVMQIVPTTAGAPYELCFALAANPDGPPTIKTLEVLWEGSRVATLTVSSEGTIRSGIRWSYHRFDVVAHGESAVLTFQSWTNGCYGAVIDDVHLQEKTATVTAAAEPASP